MRPMMPKLKPSPSPDEDSIPSQSPKVEPSEGKGRKRRHQPSVVDTVLINNLADHNLPDVGFRAGRSPLNSDSEADEPMDVDGPAAGVRALQHTAQNVLDVVGVSHEDSSTPSDLVKQEPARRAKPPRLETRDLVTRSRDASRIRSSPHPRRNTHISTGTQLDDTALPEAHRQSDLPKLSALAIFRPEGPSEATLPAIHSPSNSHPKSPANQQNLPSFQELNNDLGTSDNSTIQHNMKIHQQHAMPLQSSPSNVIGSRSAATLPSPQTRINNYTHPAFAHNQLSPSTALSPDGPSPRDITFGMSPPSTRSSGPYFVQARTAASDQRTPMSAESIPSAGTPFSSEISPNGVGRPVLPPLPDPGLLVSPNYRCDYQDCTAAPFSTQYLLKSVPSRSHRVLFGR